jgi:hypothetical protein
MREREPVLLIVWGNTFRNKEPSAPVISKTLKELTQFSRKNRQRTGISLRLVLRLFHVLRTMICVPIPRLFEYLENQEGE